jgi:hypothetical protein
MNITIARTVAIGMAAAALVGASFAATRVQAQEAPRLTDAEFQRLYDRMTGIWDFQGDKSTYTRGEPPKRWYVIYEADGDKAIKYTNRSCDTDGQEIVRVSRQVLDGADYARSGSDTSIARLPVDEFTISTTIRNAGTLTARNTQFFSADGQRMTITLRRNTEEGESVTTINVYDKVDRRLSVCAA